MRTYDFSPMFRHSVGFDRMHRLLETASQRSEVTYPPYNIETDGENAYRVTVAVAGFTQSELDITLEDGTLSIAGNHDDESKDVTYLCRGIAGRPFQLKFNLADHIEVRGADLDNGVLVVEMEHEVPEELKPRQIEIKTHPIKDLAKKTKKMIGADQKAA